MSVARTEGMSHSEGYSTNMMLFGRRPAEIVSRIDGEKIDILPYIREPEHFHQKGPVDRVVRFGQTFAPLIGEYKGQFGEWNPDKLIKEGVVILEYQSHSAKQLVGRINRLAKKFIEDPKLYDDKSACTEYYQMAAEGYHMLNQYQFEFGLSNKLNPHISLLRAGAVSTRLALGLQVEDVAPEEIPITTKRTLLTIDPYDTDLTVTVTWNNKEDLWLMHGKAVNLADFVNPASGASTAAALLAAMKEGVKPTRVDHRSISLTAQGAMFTKIALEHLGIESTFYSLGDCIEMNEQYYLSGKPVGDAGHALRRFVPKVYQQ